MKGRLLYRDAQGRDAAADVAGEGSFVGRAQDCVVRTDDAMVSRRNCKIWREGSAWLVEDLGSSNGTFVNEERIQARHPLRHADIIRCGTLQVRFVEVPEAAPAEDSGPAPSELELVQRELEAVIADRSEKEQRLVDLGRELDMLRLRTDNDQSELARLRTEVVAQRTKLGELSRVRQLTEEELNAQIRVGEQLRRDLEGTKQEHAQLSRAHERTSDDLAARDRQLERALEDVQRTKQSLDEVRGRLVELERTKDAGWRELNNRVGELDGLRAVIAEQERLLEERRVGLIALEASAQELRQDKERLLRELTGARSEREEAKAQLVMTRNQIEGYEEEHRRLRRTLSEGSAGSADESLALAADLRQARVAHKTIEAERDRLIERAERAEQARTDLEQKAARLDVELTQAVQERQRAISGRERAEEAMGRAELQRKATEEARRGLEASDAAHAAEVIRLRSELDELRSQREADLRAGAQRTATIETDRGGTLAYVHEEVTWNGVERPRVADPRAADDDPRVLRLEEELARLGSELAITRAALDGSQGGGLIRQRAEEAYHAVNDALSELRTQLLSVRRLVSELRTDDDAVEELAETISASIDRAEDAKGVLRTLRELVETP